MSKLRVTFFILLLLGLVAVSDYGEAASITIVPVGGTSYSINATDLQDSAGIDLSILYDKDALENNPKVAYGSMTAGAVSLHNATVPGSVKIAFVTTGVIKGSGQLASITFVSKGKPQAWQPKFSPSPVVIASNGSPLAVQSAATDSPAVTEVISEESPDKNSSDTTYAGMTAAPATADPVTRTQSGATVVSNMTLPASGEQNPPEHESVPKDAPQGEPETPNVPAESVVVGSDSTSSQTEEVAVAAPPPPARKAAGVRSTTALKSIQSVQEQFRTYNDVRTLQRLSHLFDMKALSAAGIAQTPDITVADGKSLVTVAIELFNEVDAPSFSLKGANMKSIRQLSDSKWELDAVPQKDKSDVRLSIIIKDERAEIALVAVPPITAAGAALLSLSDEALDAQLAKPLPGDKPAYDLNSDGIQSYLDDYILVAHWLLKQKSGAKQEDKAVPLPVKNGTAK